MKTAEYKTGHENPRNTFQSNKVDVVKTIDRDPVAILLLAYMAKYVTEEILRKLIAQKDVINEGLYKKLQYVTTLPLEQQAAIMGNMLEQYEEGVPWEELYVRQPEPVAAFI